MAKQTTLERRRAARIDAERNAAASERRGRRLRNLAIAAAAAVALVVAGALVSSAGGNKPAAAPKAATTQAALFDGLTEHAGVIGNASAPLTVTEYLDLQCPICARASHTTVPALVQGYVRTGKIKLQARTLHFIGPDSGTAARVAAGAERQGRLWPFVEAFYARQGEENSGYVTDAFLRATAAAAGVKAAPALAQQNSGFATGRLQRADADAARMKVTGTPTLTVRRGNGPERILQANPLDPASVAAALDTELGR